MENNKIDEVAITPPELGTFSHDALNEVEANKKNALVGIGIIGLFVVFLAVAFLFGGNKGSETGNPFAVKGEVQLVEPTPKEPVITDVPPAPYIPSTLSPSPDSYPAPPSQYPVPPTVTPKPGFGVPLISGTLAFDLNKDGVLTNADVAILSQAISRGEYLPLFDFNSDGVVNVNDLALIRAPLSEYPVVCYDVNDDHEINMNDISIVSQAIGRAQYVAFFDFDADGVIGTKDLALIRTVVSEDGNVTSVKR